MADVLNVEIHCEMAAMNSF